MGRKHQQRSQRQEHDELVKSLRRATHFEKDEVEWLLTKFNRLAGEEACKKNPIILDRDKFVSFLFNNFDMTEDILMDRIFRVFNTKNDNRLCQDQFVKGMSTFLKGTTSEQIKFAFSVYDFNSDGYITREEIFSMNKNCFVNQYNKVMGDEDPEEGIKDIVDMYMKKLDVDQDFRVSLNDFEEAVMKDMLLLECLGPCFPEGECKRKFLKAISDNEPL